MARQYGTVRLDGKTGGLIFYKTKYGNMVRSAWTLSKERLENDPKLQARRDANKEFGYSSRVGKLMRLAVRRCCHFAEEGPTNHRLASLIVKAVKEDKVGVRGQRKLTDENAGLLHGFRWRVESELSRVLLKDCLVQLDMASGTASLSVNGLVPKEEIRLQERATHLQLTLVIARIDYNGDASEEAFERSVMIDARSTTPVNVNLSAVLPAGVGNLFVAGIGYQVMQEVNKSMNGLTEGSGFEILEMGVL